MSFHIEQLVLYGPGERMRQLDFTPGFNVIAGEPGTGKSSILEIIDYCLGSSDCDVAHGIIRDTVRWYGLKLVGPDRELFVARQAPGVGERSNTAVFYELGSTVDVPLPSQIHETTNVSSLVKVLTEFAGIPENRIETPARSTRPSYAATIRHALFFVTQEQSEVADKRSLFHSQSEPYVAAAMTDVLPFFLGAVTDDHLRKRNEVRRLSEVSKSLREQMAQADAVRTTSESTAATLIAEAVDVGLLEQGEADAAESKVAVLGNLGLRDVPADESVEASVKALDSLFATQRELIGKKRRLVEDLTAIHGILREESGYKGERGEQRVRLASINLVPADSTLTLCPVCGGDLAAGVPSHDAVSEALTSLSEQLSDLERPNHGMQKLFAGIRSDLDQVNGELHDIKTTIVSIRQANEHVSKLRVHGEAQALVLGRISLYLDTLEASDTDDGDLTRRLEEAEQAIANLDAGTSETAVAERTARISSILNADITQMAQALGVEHSQNAVRLDTHNLTVVAETPRESIPLSRMGSAANWVSYHVVAYLALQRWFVEQRRPLPRFLLLDQPSQAFFPPELPNGELTDLEERDRNAVYSLLRLIADVSNQLDDGFQCILVEHAFFDEPWFSDAVRAKWYGGEKLIPAEWAEPAGDKPDTA